MNDKNDLNAYNIPKSDIECWGRYPKHRWVYETSRLLDVQQVNWSPFKTAELTYSASNIFLSGNTSADDITNGVVFIKDDMINKERHVSEVFVVRGEIKHIHEIDPFVYSTNNITDGSVELRLNAFTSMYMSKFTGIITYTTYGPDPINDLFIGRITLRPYISVDLWNNLDPALIKLVKRIYKKI